MRPRALEVPEKAKGGSSLLEVSEEARKGRAKDAEALELDVAVVKHAAEVERVRIGRRCSWMFRPSGEKINVIWRSLAKTSAQMETNLTNLPTPRDRSFNFCGKRTVTETSTENNSFPTSYPVFVLQHRSRTKMVYESRCHLSSGRNALAHTPFPPTSPQCEIQNTTKE